MCDCPDRSHDHPRRLPRGLDRREVLKFALAGTGIAALGPMLGRRLPSVYGQATVAKRLVVVEMSGGCDLLNVVIPTNLGSYYARRPKLRIPATKTRAPAGRA